MTCVISCLIISTDVTADDPKPSTLNKSQAAQKAQQKVNGRVLKVDQNKHKYQVKLLQKSGRVVSVNVDKKSGKVSQQGSKN
ncbi:PepSY domain-containing protein [Paraglaciecola aquimarina]|uniref:PepSY domain-containing protein n=2 Tax=Paraglaciecola algarum TaxID=3050085 RepID=A0ABS9DAG8_9ALTE|nr:PepSY domain-containing protein [Paraglaciecola sp. G1-23]